MTGSRVRRPVRVAACALLLLMPGEVAAAASSVSSGWWTTAATPPPPDVSRDGLLVQSTITTTAYAAVSFSLDDDERAELLTLRIVEGSMSNPSTTLRLCPLTEPIEEAQGGAAADAPDYDCSDSIDAAPEEGSYVFDVSSLPSGPTFGVAVLPTGPLDRAVLARPDVDSLSTVMATEREAPGGPGASPTPSPSPGTGIVTAPPLAPFAPSGTPVEVTDLPPIDEPAVAPPTTAVSREVAQPTLPVETTGSTTSRIAQVALAGALLATLVLWITSGTLAHTRARRDRHGASAPA